MAIQDRWASGALQTSADEKTVRPAHLAVTARGVSRLLVLVPGLDMYPAEFASQIRALAADRGLGVLLVGLSVSREDVWAWRRSLTTLAAALNETGDLRATIEVSTADNWVEAARGLCRDGDLVVCVRDQVFEGVWPWQREALSRALVSHLRVPVCDLEATGIGQTTIVRPLSARILSWATSLAIIAAFGVLQYAIQVNTTPSLGMVLMSGTVVVELILLAVLA